MFFDSRMRGLGRGRVRVGSGGGGAKKRQDAQEVLGTTQVEGAATSVVGDVSSVGTLVGDTLPTGQGASSTSTAVVVLQTEVVQVTSSTSTFSEPMFMPSSSTMQAVISSPSPTSNTADGAQGATSIASSSMSSSTASNEDGNIQTTATGSSSSISSTHQTPTASNGHQRAAESKTTSAGQNTWITATTVEASSSGVTIVPIITFGVTSSAPSTLDSASKAASGTFSPAGPSASSLVQTPYLSGAASTSRVGLVAGITAGAVGLLFLVFLAVIVYTRKGAIAMVGSRMQSKLSNLHPSLKKAPLANQSQENLFRREIVEIRPRDLEGATIPPEAHFDDKQEGWEEIDLRGARTGQIRKDKGEWLDSWRRGKEKVTTRRPPALVFDPGFPLPPIKLEEARRKS